MKRFMQYKHGRTEALDAHPFISWLDADNVALEDKLGFAPIMALFVMAFRDVNLWVLRFEEEAEEHFRSLINGNTFEDEGHSRLFLHDWRCMGLDARLRWSASDTLWWLFHSPDQERFREYGVEFVRFSVEDGGDPLLRFAHSEAGEACGMVFFSHSVHPAVALGEAQGKTYRYFGTEHLERELSHVEHTEEDFVNQVLDEAGLAKAVDLGGRMFDVFHGIFDAFLDYAHAHVEGGTVPQAPADHGAQGCGLPRHPVEDLSGFAAPEGEVSSSAARLLAKLDARRAQAAAHPLYAWMREASVPAADKLRRFMPLWSMDVLGYRDLNHFVFHYANGASAHARAPEARLINAWVNELETHSGLFLRDWQALGLDERLGWSASETLEFLFFDRAMDVHRHNIMRFMKLGLRHDHPSLRYWMMRALEASGEAFFANTRELARAAEASGELAGPLDYLGDRHGGEHPERGVDLDALLRGTFHAHELDAEQLAVAEQMIDVVFDSLEHQLDFSLEAAHSGRLDYSLASAAE